MRHLYNSCHVKEIDRTFTVRTKSILDVIIIIAASAKDENFSHDILWRQIEEIEAITIGQTILWIPLGPKHRIYRRDVPNSGKINADDTDKHIGLKDEKREQTCPHLHTSTATNDASKQRGRPNEEHEWPDEETIQFCREAEYNKLLEETLSDQEKNQQQRTDRTDVSTTSDAENNTMEKATNAADRTIARDSETSARDKNLSTNRNNRTSDFIFAPDEPSFPVEDGQRVPQSRDACDRTIWNQTSTRSVTHSRREERFSPSTRSSSLVTSPTGLTQDEDSTQSKGSDDDPCVR